MQSIVQSISNLAEPTWHDLAMLQQLLDCAAAVDQEIALRDAEATLALLPEDPAFEEHRAFAANTVDEYRLWQPRYLDALREGNQELAIALIADVEQLVESVDSALVPALVQLRSEVDLMLLAVNEEIVVVVAAIP